MVVLSLLPCSGTGRRIGRKKAKLVGWDKESLTEQQTEKKITTIILIKRIYRVQFSHRPTLSLPPHSKLPCPSQLPYFNTEHDVTWYQTSHLIGCLGHPTQLLVKIDPIPAKPRTESKFFWVTNYYCSSQRSCTLPLPFLTLKYIVHV